MSNSALFRGVTWIIAADAIGGLCQEKPTGLWQDKSTCHVGIEAADAASLLRGNLFGRVHVDRESRLNSMTIYAQASNRAFAQAAAQRP
jgi:hypothetical protein